MALRNQPYMPLYVQDYLTDEKLNMCSASTQGVYIKIMCILHKQNEYGSLLLKQKDKQNGSACLNFAYKFAKLLPFDQQTILDAINELIEEDVLSIEGDKIYQKRMVKDGQISDERSKAGKKGGGNPNLFKQNTKQIVKQIPENENEIKEYNKEAKNEKYSQIKSRLLEMSESEKINILRPLLEKYPRANVAFIDIMIKKFLNVLLATDDIYKGIHEYRMFCGNWIKKYCNDNPKEVVEIIKEIVNKERDE